jgi:hypothetical protein
VLVEADYRMKCTAIGLEPPPVPMTTYAAALRSPPANNLQRWWFTPNYDCVRISDDGLAMEMAGQGVQLQTEDRVIGKRGELAPSSRPTHPAAAAFAKSFTEKFPAISAASPVYAELRNLIDLAIAAAWLRKQDAEELTGWPADLLRDETQLKTETLAVPKKVSCVANGFWSGNRLLVPAGGGVSISPDEALDKGHLLPNDQALAARRVEVSRKIPAERWWWDWLDNR